MREPENGWMPIETAPKDGTPFLAYQRNGGPDLYPCWFVNDQYEGAFWQNDYDNEPSPSHWRPLPAPPSHEEGDTA